MVYYNNVSTLSDNSFSLNFSKVEQYYNRTNFNIYGMVLFSIFLPRVRNNICLFWNHMVFYKS